jgi:HEPN domain-containing protein
MSASLPSQWLEKATEDLIVARLVFNEGYMAHVCFLAQQCIEKSLKAYLLGNSNTYPRTHKLVDLLGQCENLEPTFAQFQSGCIVVDQYYIPARYPNGVPGELPGGTPGQTEAQESLDTAERILQFVTTRLP